MDGPEEDTIGDETRIIEKLTSNEIRCYENIGFHDGYDKGKEDAINESRHAGYKKAFEQNFVLFTLKGVAHALKSSLKSGRPNNNQQHIAIIENMKFDNVNSIEILKKDLINICRANKLEILAHYVAQIK